MRRFSSSTSSTATSTSCEVETILPGMDVLLGPAHLGDVDQALDARLELDEGAIFGDVGDPALEHAADRIFGGGALPRIALELLHAEADALGLAVDADDLHLHRVADVDHLARVADALVADVGDVEQAVDAAEIDEGAVIGDVLDDAVDDLALGEATGSGPSAARRGSLRGWRGARRRYCRGGGPSSGSGRAAGGPSAGRRRGPGGCRPG